MKKGASITQATTAQNIHDPNVLVVLRRGSFLIEYNKSETLQLGSGVNHEGKSINTGIKPICIGVAAKLIAIAIVVIAGLNAEAITTEQRNRVANVERAGIGKTPPQNPAPMARPTCVPESDFAGLTSLVSNQFLIVDIS